jgi:hypothetical protein
MSHSPEGWAAYLKKRQDYISSLPSVTDAKPVEAETIVEEPKEEEEIKVEKVEEEVDQELLDLQAKYKEVTGKNLSPAYKSNKERIATKIAEATPAE